jgi:pimeloyl-ACP methyl ester carboxylesterase
MEAMLPEVLCATLVIQGEPDPYGSIAQVEAIRSRAGGPVETIALPGGGHSPHAERPDDVLDAMAGFVQRLPDAGTA